MITTSRNRTFYLTTYILYLFLFASLVFSLRALSSISIAAILLTGIIGNRLRISLSFPKNYRTLFLVGCTALFLLQVFSMLYTNDVHAGWNNVRIKTGLLITPLSVYLSRYLDRPLLRKLFFHYCLLLTAASVFCLVMAFFKYRESGNISVFFYHSLVSPISQHAVYFSLQLMFALIFLVERAQKNDTLLARSLGLCLIACLSLFLILLSSKLVISLFLFYLLAVFIITLRKNKSSRAVIASLFTLIVLGVIFVFAVPNPVSRRFSEIVKGNISIVTQDKFKPSDYFNGLQFRLLQWKFVPEILTENKRWLIGVSPGDAQTYLNEKYISKNMYSGDPVKGTRGYLIYNTHNQFLQTTLQTGIVGLLLLIVICYYTLKMAMKYNSRPTIFITVTLLAWLFSESAFETQYGIVIFTFFPIFLTAADIFNTPIETPTPQMQIE